MKIKLNSILTLLVAALIFTSCSSDDDATPDTQKPTIAIIEPHNDDEIAPGGEIHFEALFSDNVELASYKIEIHDDFDDHTHAQLKSSHDLNPWSFEQVFQIPAGQRSFEAEQHIDVPTTFNGEPISEGIYHLGVYVTDTSGNEEQAFLSIHIEGDHGDEDHDHGHDH
ncbi:MULTISPECIES: DUF4625 domain-containing protein [Antarcticibacterium]|nr:MULTISPECIES: DUF4625 domain-containing protein [Antarcticibacterium]